MKIVASEDVERFAAGTYQHKLTYNPECSEDWDEIILWCEDQFGPDGLLRDGDVFTYNSVCEWTFLGDDFFFKRGTHAFAFRMRWM